MNRKTMVLTAAAGLLTPVLTACGSTSGGAAGTGAIIVGTTDRFEAADYAPAPLDPAYAYDAGSWNILRQTIQTLMHTPAAAASPSQKRPPTAASPTPATRATAAPCAPASRSPTETRSPHRT